MFLNGIVSLNTFQNPSFPEYVSISREQLQGPVVGSASLPTAPPLFQLGPHPSVLQTGGNGHGVRKIYG